MKVRELIEKLSSLNPELEVAAGYPAVAQADTTEHRESLCRIDDAKEIHIDWDTWMGRDFVLIEIWPEVTLATQPPHSPEPAR